MLGWTIGAAQLSGKLGGQWGPCSVIDYTVVTSAVPLKHSFCLASVNRWDLREKADRFDIFLERSHVKSAAFGGLLVASEDTCEHVKMKSCLQTYYFYNRNVSKQKNL